MASKEFIKIRVLRKIIEPKKAIFLKEKAYSKGVPASGPILFVASRHVETIIMMMNCGRGSFPR